MFPEKNLKIKEMNTISYHDIMDLHDRAWKHHVLNSREPAEMESQINPSNMR